MELSQDMIKNYFKEIFQQIAPEIIFEKINLFLPLRDQVEIDSLDFYNIVVSFQKKTGIFISDTKIAEFKSLNELIIYIFDQAKKQGVLNESKS
jgi:acyl carrier protein